MYAAVDEEDLAAELAVLPPETLGVVVIRDVELVSETLRAFEASLAKSASKTPAPGANGEAAGTSGALPTGSTPTAGPGPGALHAMSAAVLGIRWRERRGGVVSWSSTAMRLTLPAEDLLALDPLVVAIGGARATAKSACSMTNFRHAWVTCTIPLGEEQAHAVPTSVTRVEGASSTTALRDAILELSRDGLAPGGPAGDVGTSVTPSIRLAWRVSGGTAIARAGVVLDTPNSRVDVVLPESLATAIVPCSARVPTILAAVGDDRSFAWWSVDPEGVNEVIDALPAPLARAAKQWTGESLVVAAESPDRTEFVFAIHDPGPILGAFGLTSLAGMLGVDVGALLPEWALEVEQVSAFSQRFEVLSLTRGVGEAPAPAPADAAAWHDVRVAFATPTVDALWVGLGVSLQDLAASPEATRHALRLERGATLDRLPSRVKPDLAAGHVSALASLDVMTLLEPRAIETARSAWRSVDARSEGAWGDSVANLAAPLRSWLPESTRLVVWTREVGPFTLADEVTRVGAAGLNEGVAAPQSLPSSRAVHLHVELCTSCGEGDVPVGGRDFETPTRALVAIVGSYVATLAVTRRRAP